MDNQEKRIYPDHLYDPTRREIAIQLLDKELNKQLHTESSDGKLDVQAWAEALDDHTFWNAVEGFMGGALLKPIVHFLTAENYQWSAQDIPVKSIKLSSKLTQLERLNDLAPDNLQLALIDEQLQNSPDERTYQLEAVQKLHRTDVQDAFPILAVEKDGFPMVMDGNRRSLQALLMGKETIRAWYCTTNGEQPENYWYPIDDMMRITKVYNSSKEIDPTIKDHVRSVLRAIFSQSEVARIAYEERIAKAGTPGAKDLIGE